jgi:hypothetical protein
MVRMDSAPEKSSLCLCVAGRTRFSGAQWPCSDSMAPLNHGVHHHHRQSTYKFWVVLRHALRRTLRTFIGSIEPGSPPKPRLGGHAPGRLCRPEVQGR